MFLRKKIQNKDKTPKLIIHETNNIRDILKHCTYNSFIVLDLDNTVIESDQELGSDQWFVNLINYASKIIPDESEAINLVILIYHAVQHYAKMKAVETNIIHIIKVLQDINIPVIAVSARGSAIIEPTLKQLNEIGIHFSRQWEKEIIELDIGVKDTPPIYQDGIIFCSGHDKGKSLEAFFEKFQCYPHHVVMIDDKAKHLKCVYTALQKFGAEFVGLRYGYLDEKVACFDMNKAKSQLNTMMHLFSHRELKVIKKLKICDNFQFEDKNSQSKKC